jgi:chloride channel 3/4/5
LFFNAEGTNIKSLFEVSKHYKIALPNLILFAFVWFVFTTITFGVWCPAGLFLPGIIMGGSMGRCYTMAMQNWQGYNDDNEIMQNTVLGAASMLCGYCRLTYSLAVLMLETTQSVNLFIPMFITIMFSYLTGLLFNQSLYFRSLRAKQVPYLRHSVPAVNKNLRAKMLMKPFPVTLECVAKVSDIERALEFGYTYFPVINLSGQVVGSICADFLIVLIEQRAWYSKTYSGYLAFSQAPNFANRGVASEVSNIVNAESDPESR